MYKREIQYAMSKSFIHVYKGYMFTFPNRAVTRLIATMKSHLTNLSSILLQPLSRKGQALFSNTEYYTI